MASNITIRNIHGVFTATPRALAYYSAQSKEWLVATLLDVYQGSEWSGRRSHFARYSLRTLAIMVADCFGESMINEHV